MTNLVKRMAAGESDASIRKEMLAHDKDKAKEDGKMFGECDSCGFETVLVADLGMCGPCTFGEAETANGNW